MMPKININGKILILLFPVFLLFTCKSDIANDPLNIPYVPVSVTINLDLPANSNLAVIGGYIYRAEGYRGIIIYHSGVDEFIAIERTCTYSSLDDCAKVTVDNSGTFLKCGHYTPDGKDWISCCDSKYTMDGFAVLQGPAKYGLRHYYVTLEGTTLRVYN